MKHYAFGVPFCILHTNKLYLKIKEIRVSWWSSGYEFTSQCGANML